MTDWTPPRKLTRLEKAIIRRAERQGVDPDPGELFAARELRMTARQRSQRDRLDVAGDDLSLTEACKIAPDLLGRPEIVRAMAARNALPFALVESPRGPRIRTRDLATLIGVPLSRDDPRQETP